MNRREGVPSEHELPFKKVESFFFIFLRSIHDFLVLILFIAFRPANLGRRLIRNNRRVNYYSLLCVTGFFAIKLVKFASMCAIAMVVISIRGCTSNYYEDPKLPSLLNLISLPSFDNVIFQCVPIILIALSLVKLMKVVMGIVHSRDANILYIACCYVVGFQFLLWFPACVILYILGGMSTYDIPTTDGSGGPWILFSLLNVNSVFYWLLLSSFFILIAWPAMSLYFMLHFGLQLKNKNHQFQKNNYFLAFVSLVFCAISITTPIIVTAPSIWLEYKKDYRDVFLLKSSFIESNGGFSLNKPTIVYVKNNSKERLSFTISEIMIYNSQGTRFFGSASIVNGDGTVVSLPPQGYVLLSVTPKEASGGEDDSSLPSQNRIEFCSILGIGNHQKRIGTFIWSPQGFKG